MEGHTQHGGESEAPAHGLAPPRIHVGVVVDQRLVVHHVEDEDALWVRTPALSRWRARGVPPPAQPPLALTMQTSGVKKDQHHFIQGQGRYPIMQATSSMNRSAPGAGGLELETPATPAPGHAPSSPLDPDLPYTQATTTHSQKACQSRVVPLAE